MQEEQLKRFINNRDMSEAVFDVLLNSFLKDRGSDVYILAASRLSIDFLKLGWKEMEKFKGVAKEPVNKSTNPGL